MAATAATATRTERGSPPPDATFPDLHAFVDELLAQPAWNPGNKAIIGTPADTLSPWSETHILQDLGQYPKFYWELTQAERDDIGPVICIAQRRAPKQGVTNIGKVDKELMALRRGFRRFPDINQARSIIAAKHHTDATEAAYSTKKQAKANTKAAAKSKGTPRRRATAASGPAEVPSDFDDRLEKGLAKVLGRAAVAGSTNPFVQPPLPGGPPPQYQYGQPFFGQSQGTLAASGYQGLTPQTAPYFQYAQPSTVQGGSQPPLSQTQGGFQQPPPQDQGGSQQPQFQFPAGFQQAAPQLQASFQQLVPQLDPQTGLPTGYYQLGPTQVSPQQTDTGPSLTGQAGPPSPSGGTTGLPQFTQGPVHPSRLVLQPGTAAAQVATDMGAVTPTAQGLSVSTTAAGVHAIIPPGPPGPAARDTEQAATGQEVRKKKKKKIIQVGPVKKQRGPGPGKGGGGSGSATGTKASSMNENIPQKRVSRRVANRADAQSAKSACEQVSDTTDQSEQVTDKVVRSALTVSQVKAVGSILDLTSGMELEFHWTSAHSLPSEVLDKLEKGLSVLVSAQWLLEPEPLMYHFVRPKQGVEVTSAFHQAWQAVALFMRLCLASQFLHATASGVYRHYTWCEIKQPNSIRHRIYAPPLALCGLPVHQANAARQSKLFKPFLQSADQKRQSKLIMASHSDRVSGFHHAPRIDNSGPNPVFLINGVALDWLTVDTGCESVIISDWTAKRIGITPSMRQKKAISLITADAVTTAPVDRTWDTVEIAINPYTSATTTVQVKLTIVPSKTKETLVGMSVIGRIGLTPNPYKQTMTYYTRWWEEESPTAELPAIFNVDLINNSISAATSSRIQPITLAYAGRLVATPPPRPPTLYESLCTGPLGVPQADSDVRSVRVQLEFRDQLDMQSIIAHFQRTLRSLTDPPPPAVLLAARYGSPLDQNFVDIHEQTAVNSEGIVIVELCSGLCATTEALVRNGVKIRRVYACEIEPSIRIVAQQRLATLVQLFPHLITAEAIATCHEALPEDITKINAQHVAAIEPPNFIVAGFPCQGFSSAATRPLGLRDTRTALFYTCVEFVHMVYRHHGPCVWLFENVDATDHRDTTVAYEYNHLIKGILGQGVAFDAVAVGSYAHRHRRFWTNGIPASLLSHMVDQAFVHRITTQSVSEIIEPHHEAQLAAHESVPGSYVVNEKGKPLRAFSTFVTVKGSHAYRDNGHSLLVNIHTNQLEEPSANEREAAMGFMVGTTQNPAVSEADRVRMLGGTMDMHQIKYVTGAILVFQHAFFLN